MSDKTKSTLLEAVATSYTLIEYDPRKNRSFNLSLMELKVDRRSTNPEAWAISDRGNVLGKDGLWEYEPMPSSRDNEFLERFRWNSAEEAIQFAQDHMKRYPSGSKPEMDDTNYFGAKTV